MRRCACAVILGLLKTLMVLGGIIATLLGAVFTLAGAYGLAEETHIISIVGETTLGAQEGGLIFSVVGITVLVGGAVMAWNRMRALSLNKKVIILHIIAWSVALLWILPFLGVFMASIRPFSEILRGWWIFDPFNPSLNSFVTAWNDPTYPLSRGLINSFIVAVPSTIVPLFVGALAGYGFARFSFRIRSYLFLTIVLLMALPQQSVVVPLFQIMVRLRLIDNYLSLVLIHSAWGLPWIILFMRNFFSTLPIEVEEAARVDGASDFKIFYKIVLPMALPALASVVVLQFMWVWNDFFLARVFIYEESMLLATQRIEYVGREGPLGRIDWGVLSAASTIVMIVPILIFVLLQKYYVKGMVGWTVKG